MLEVNYCLSLRIVVFASPAEFVLHRDKLGRDGGVPPREEGEQADLRPAAMDPGFYALGVHRAQHAGRQG